MVVVLIAAFPLLVDRLVGLVEVHPVLKDLAILEGLDGVMRLQQLHHLLADEDNKVASLVR